MLEISTNVDITPYSAFKTKATASFFVEIKSELDALELVELYSEFKSKSLPILILGAGTNCLFAFDNFPGLVVLIKLFGVQRLKEDNYWLGSSELVSPLSIQFTKNEVTNALIPWIGLPGTIGGAIVGNAGCFWLETKDILLCVKVVNLESGTITEMWVEDLNFGYRNSCLKNQKNLLVLGWVFSLGSRNDNLYAHTSIIDMIAIRRQKQPAGVSCGSFYTNPTGNSAGRLIDMAGCKGMRVWGVRISEMHGNFFLVDGEVTYKDILDLSERVKKKVYETSGVSLHEEVRIIYI